MSRTISGLAPPEHLAGWCASSEEAPLLAESESLQKLVANIRGQIEFRACGFVICNRPAYALPYRGCDKGVNVALIRPALHDCHTRDLSAFVDLVRHDRAEVGIVRKQRVEVGHDVVQPDESMVPVALRVE